MYDNILKIITKHFDLRKLSRTKSALLCVFEHQNFFGLHIDELRADHIRFVGTFRPHKCADKAFLAARRSIALHGVYRIYNREIRVHIFAQIDKHFRKRLFFRVTAVQLRL